MSPTPKFPQPPKWCHLLRTKYSNTRRTCGVTFHNQTITGSLSVQMSKSLVWHPSEDQIYETLVYPSIFASFYILLCPLCPETVEQDSALGLSLVHSWIYTQALTICFCSFSGISPEGSVPSFSMKANTFSTVQLVFSLALWNDVIFPSYSIILFLLSWNHFGWVFLDSCYRCAHGFPHQGLHSLRVWPLLLIHSGS